MILNLMAFGFLLLSAGQYFVSGLYLLTVISLVLAIVNAVFYMKGE